MSSPEQKDDWLGRSGSHAGPPPLGRFREGLLGFAICIALAIALVEFFGDNAEGVGGIIFLVTIALVAILKRPESQVTWHIPSDRE